MAKSFSSSELGNHEKFEPRHGRLNRRTSETAGNRIKKYASVTEQSFCLIISTKQ